MTEFLATLPQWLLVAVALVFLVVFLERTYISKKPFVIAGKEYGPPSPSADVDAVSKSNQPNEYQPFILTQSVNADSVKQISNQANAWEKILQRMSANEFFALHSWHSESERHDLALLCLDIAISKGMATSKNYSFRSASLRKLGRLKEARASAEYALSMSNDNVDAHYNLAKIFREMGLEEKAEAHTQAVLNSRSSIYLARLLETFPELRTHTNTANETPGSDTVLNCKC